MTVIIAILTVIAAYLLGSVNFAVIFSRAFSHSDVRESGSGNAGTTNVLRVNGVLPGLLTFAFDALKGFAACKLGEIVFSMIVAEQYSSAFADRYAGAYFCAVACMLGKGVAICVGIFSVCCPIAIIVGLIVFSAVTAISKYVSLGSLVATVVVIVLATIFRIEGSPAGIQIVCCIVMASLIYIKHLSNIKRLIAGKEHKLGTKAK